MARTAYVNGRYVSIDEPAVMIEDRGFQFADGVYEVIKCTNGEPRALERHLDRLERSLAGLRMKMPTSRAALRLIIAETLRRNPLEKAIVYLQVSRGTAARNHLFPKPATRPSLIVTVRRAPFPKPHEIEDGVAVVTRPDIRWQRCDVKSVSLLANVLAKQEAADAGAREAWLYDAAGYVTEGSTANAYIVTAEGTIVTRPRGHEILGGITREVLFEVAEAAGIPVEERPFSVAEAKTAREAFLTSTSSLILPVTRIDDTIIANGKPGAISRRLLAQYLATERLEAVV